jgi:N-acetylneuraminic acid mutarotase
MTTCEDNIYLFGGIHEVTWELDDLYIYNPKVQT